jgi:hypothetical protein
VVGLFTEYLALCQRGLNLQPYIHISVKHNYGILFRKLTTCFGVRERLQPILTKIIKMRCSRVQIELVMCDST